MIHSCFVCNRPAIRVCNYYRCTIIPFLCGDTCKDNQNKAELMHTHNGKTNFIPYGEVINAAVETKQVNNPLVSGLREKKVAAERHWEKGKKFIGAGNFQLAIAEFMQACSVFPHEAKYLKQISDLINAVDNQQKQEALNHYKKAREYYKNQKFQLALIEVTQAIQLDGGNFNYFFLRGNICADLREFKYAIEDYNRALETNGKITDYFYFCKGFAEYRAGDYNNSLISLSKSIELEKTNAVSYNERGSVFCSMGLFREALADFTKAVEIDGENAGYHYNRGLAFYKIRNYKQALIDYNKAIELFPKHGDYFCNRGLVYYELKQYNKAIDDYNTAISLNDHHVLYWQNRGNAYHALLNFEQAINDYGKAIEVDPGNAGCYWNRGNSKKILGDYMGALVDYTKAIELDSDSDTYYHSRGLVYKIMQDYKKSLEDFNKSLELDNEASNVYFDRAQLYKSMEQYQKSIRDFTKAIELDSNYGLLFASRGHTYILMKKYDKALIDLNKAIELSETQRNYRLRSFLFNKMGNFQQSKIDQDKAKQIEQNEEE